MYRVSTFALAVVLFTGVFATAPARASDPEDRVATYKLRVDPNNESSDIIFLVELDLTAVDHDEDEIAWQVTQARFSETDAEGTPVRTWSIDDPELHTVDNLWWVAHEDLDEPSVEDFTAVPQLEGVAEAQGPDGDLEFAIASTELDPLERLMYGGAVAGVAHDFHEVGEEDPVIDPDDEPAEVGGGSVGS
jgi:hypothetical protein